VYDVGVALRRHRMLIKWTAWRWRLALKMSFEDLEAEGLLLLVDCCRTFPVGQTRFSRYFKRAWYRRLKRFYRDSRALKRQGVEVELEDASTTAIQPDSSDFIERVWLRYHEISSLLSPDARRLLQALIDPPSQVYEEAWRDFCRKNKLRSLGQGVTGDRRFRVRLTHIRRALGMSSRRMREVVTEVKSVNRKYNRRKRK
jgi:hypothetical protein